MTVAEGDWRQVAEESDFADTDRKQFDIDGKQAIVFKVEDEYFAVGAWCSHQKWTLMDGEVEDHEIECIQHGARFDLRTGKNLCLPAVRPIPSYPLKVEAGTIYIQV